MNPSRRRLRPGRWVRTALAVTTSICVLAVAGVAGAQGGLTILAVETTGDDSVVTIAVPPGTATLPADGVNLTVDGRSVGSTARPVLGDDTLLLLVDSSVPAPLFRPLQGALIEFARGLPADTRVTLADSSSGGARQLGADRDALIAAIAELTPNPGGDLAGAIAAGSGQEGGQGSPSATVAVVASASTALTGLPSTVTQPVWAVSLGGPVDEGSPVGQVTTSSRTTAVAATAPEQVLPALRQVQDDMATRYLVRTPEPLAGSELVVSLAANPEITATTQLGSTASTVAPTTTEAPTTTAADDGSSPATPAQAEDDGGLPGWVLPALAVLLVALLVLALVLIRRRRRAEREAEPESYPSPDELIPMAPPVLDHGAPAAASPGQPPAPPAGAPSAAAPVPPGATPAPARGNLFERVGGQQAPDPAAGADPVTDVRRTGPFGDAVGSPEGASTAPSGAGSAWPPPPGATPAAPAPPGGPLGAPPPAPDATVPRPGGTNGAGPLPAPPAVPPMPGAPAPPPVSPAAPVARRRPTVGDAGLTSAERDAVAAVEQLAALRADGGPVLPVKLLVALEAAASAWLDDPNTSPEDMIRLLATSDGGKLAPQVLAIRRCLDLPPATGGREAGDQAHAALVAPSPGAVRLPVPTPRAAQPPSLLAVATEAALIERVDRYGDLAGSSARAVLATGAARARYLDGVPLVVSTSLVPDGERDPGGVPLGRRSLTMMLALTDGATRVERAERALRSSVPRAADRLRSPSAPPGAAALADVLGDQLVFSAEVLANRASTDAGSARRIGEQLVAAGVFRQAATSVDGAPLWVVPEVFDSVTEPFAEPGLVTESARRSEQQAREATRLDVGTA